MRERKHLKELFEVLLNRTAKNTEVSYKETRICVQHFIDNLQHFIEVEEPINIRIPYLGIFHTNEKRFFVNKKENGKSEKVKQTDSNGVDG